MATPACELDAPLVAERIDQVRQRMSGVRAEPYAFGSDELTALELVLMQRAAGMPVESPAVRP